MQGVIECDRVEEVEFPCSGGQSEEKSMQGPWRKQSKCVASGETHMNKLMALGGRCYRRYLHLGTHPVMVGALVMVSAPVGTRKT